MSRASLTLVAALALLASGGTSATASARFVEAEAGPRSPLASVRLADCARGPLAGDRLAVFRGSMTRLRGTERMWMRFKLQERVGEGRFRTVAAPGIGAWRKSRPGVRRFAYRQRVLALAEGSAYRTVVSFRWYGTGGEIIRRATRRSPPCTQPGPVANLRVRRIGGAWPLAGVPGTYRYAVDLINDGQIRAERFSVRLAVDERTVDTQAVGVLEPGDSRRLFLSGPPCQGEVTAVADPDDTVREAFEKDNTLTSSCPSGP